MPMPPHQAAAPNRATACTKEGVLETDPRRGHWQR